MIDIMVFWVYNKSSNMLNTIFKTYHDKLISPSVAQEHRTFELIVLE